MRSTGTGTDRSGRSSARTVTCGSARPIPPVRASPGVCSPPCSPESIDEQHPSRPRAAVAPVVGWSWRHGVLAKPYQEGQLDGLCGAHHHFAMLSGRDASRHQLFDSSGLRRLAKAACGLPRSSARHRFATGALLILEVRSGARAKAWSLAIRRRSLRNRPADHHGGTVQIARSGAARTRVRAGDRPRRGSHRSNRCSRVRAGSGVRHSQLGHEGERRGANLRRLRGGARSPLVRGDVIRSPWQGSYHRCGLARS